MERKCSCGNFFDVRECNGICPECEKDIFNQSTQDNNVSKKTNNMKYRLINLETKEEHLCDKVTIEGFDYYALKTDISINDYITDGYKVIKWVDNQSLLGRGKVIATNNPNIDIPKVVHDFVSFEGAKDLSSFVSGYNKAKEQFGNSDEDMIEFARFVSSNMLKHSDENGMYLGNEKVLQLWNQQQPIKVYFK